MKISKLKFSIVTGIIAISLFVIQVVVANAAETTVTVSVSFSNLANPGDEHYEGWLITDESAIPAGKFTVDDQGMIKDLDGNEVSSFDIENVDISKVTKYVLTLEPAGDANTDPAPIKPLAGDFNSENEASLSINLGVALGTVSGGYILATPSDGDNNNELAGIWYLDPSAGPGSSLVLPNLTDTNWVYEGWIVVDGQALSTGRFNTSAEYDSFDGYSGDQGYPPFPGEDFIQNAPSGLSFPMNITGTKAVISIEPRDDNSADPFQFKPLVADISETATDHTYYSMDDNSGTFATGTVSMKEKSGNAPFNGVTEAFFVLIGISALSLIFKKKKNI